MMRLPACDDASGLDACFVGIPMDIGASNRSGTRFGPRQIRAESSMLRPYNMATGAAPFDHMQVGDIGDVPINTFDLKDTIARIATFYRDLLQHDVVPLTMGGDHTLTYPV
ncbi:MAG: agmatinase, partial [Marivivens sp.]|nr:agmatinase [Marivivens sp.]